MPDQEPVSIAIFLEECCPIGYCFRPDPAVGNFEKPGIAGQLRDDRMRHQVSQPGPASLGVVGRKSLGEVVALFLGEYVLPDFKSPIFLELDVTDIFQCEPKVVQDLSCDAFIILEEPEEEMLRADHVMAELTGRLGSVFDGALGKRRERNHVESDSMRGRGRNEFLDLLPNVSRVPTESLQDLITYSPALLKDCD